MGPLTLLRWYLHSCGRFYLFILSFLVFLINIFIKSLSRVPDGLLAFAYVWCCMFFFKIALFSPCCCNTIFSLFGISKVQRWDNAALLFQEGGGIWLKTCQIILSREPPAPSGEQRNCRWRTARLVFSLKVHSGPVFPLHHPAGVRLNAPVQLMEKEMSRLKRLWLRLLRR